MIRFTKRSLAKFPFFGGPLVWSGALEGQHHSQIGGHKGNLSQGFSIDLSSSAYFRLDPVGQVNQNSFTPMAPIKRAQDPSSNVP
jgi:hypothetical protein